MERHNKVIWIIVAVAITVFITGVKREIKNADSKGTNIICFGDSITAGHVVSPSESYQALLSRMTGRPVVNAGIDTDTSREALKRLESDVLSRDPLLVIIEFGGNDFLDRVPIEDTARNIAEIADKIQAQGAMVAIFDISAGIIFNDYHKVLQKLALRKKAIFIPFVLEGILTNSSLKSDSAHPNSIGYRAIVHRVYSEIITSLNQNALSSASKTVKHKRRLKINKGFPDRHSLRSCAISLRAAFGGVTSEFCAYLVKSKAESEFQ